MTHKPLHLLDTFRPGMSAPDLAKASRLSHTTVLQWLSRQTPGKLYRRKVGRTYRYYPRQDEAQDNPQPPMQPLQKAFSGPAVIPVREGGRIVPINLNRGYL